jgi:hypothetical protein
MLGLCHRCLSSGLEVKVTRGFIHCSQCPPQPMPKVAKVVNTTKLPFEDLPQGDPKTRHQYAYRVLINLADQSLVEKMALDRLLDKD